MRLCVILFYSVIGKIIRQDIGQMSCTQKVYTRDRIIQCMEAQRIWNQHWKTCL
jgi:hypothetical protein